MIKIRNVMFAAVIAFVFAFGISVVSGSNAYAFQGSRLMSSNMKNMQMSKKTSKNKKDSKSKKALNKMGAGCL
ncbi:MAG: hypothetical protein ACYDDB_04700 [bacterium]